MELDYLQNSLGRYVMLEQAIWAIKAEKMKWQLCRCGFDQRLVLV